MHRHATHRLGVRTASSTPFEAGRPPTRGLFELRQTRWFVALVITAALALAGCTSTPTPGPTPTSSPASPTITQTPVAPSPPRMAPPQRPDAMLRNDVEGAAAAAQYFLELYPYAYNTGDLTEWKAMSHPECIFCASVIDGVEELHATGGYQTGGEIQWLSVRAVPAPDPSSVAVDAVAAQSPTSQVLGANSEQISSGGEANLFIDLKWDARWSIRGVDVETAQGDGS